MPDAPGKGEHAALSLYQLLAAPLYALIQAESYAASATADFIEQVGFEKPESNSTDTGLGHLRTLTFQQQRRTSDGQASSYRIEVPLLSMLPIPALQIKEADLEFYVKIVDMLTQERTESQDAEAQFATPFGNVSRVPVPAQHIDMKAQLGRGQPNSAVAPHSAFDMQMHIKIKVAQADPPAGLARMFNLLEQGISSTRMEEPPNAQPPTEDEVS